jgi:hypothetical protein
MGWKVRTFIEISKKVFFHFLVKDVRVTGNRREGWSGGEEGGRGEGGKEEEEGGGGEEEEIG